MLVLAYAFEPDRGSEPGAGWEWATAAATHHDVWVVTSARHRTPTDRELAARPVPGLRQVLYLEDEVGLARGRALGRMNRATYFRWQRAAAPVLRRLHAEHRFDLGHHLTWGVDWQPTAVSRVPGLPYVWGPVGGSTSTSLRLARWLGARGLAADLAREVISRPARRLFGDRVAAGASLVLAQNDDVRRRFAGHGRVEIVPNAAIRLPPDAIRANDPTKGARRRAVYAGRLEAWKGPRLAVAAAAAAPGWTLDVYGDGPEAAALRRSVEKLGVDDRVRLHGRRPRDEVLVALARADALLLPSVHDSSPWVVAEAVSLGTPVVCLDRGGPPNLARVPLGGRAVPTGGRVVEALAAALDDLPTLDPVDWWSTDRLPDLVRDLYDRALATSAAAVA